MYHEYAFGPRKLSWLEIDSAHTAAEDLENLADEDLEGMRMTNWGEEWPAWRIFTTLIHHDLQHGGEIGVLRDLYRIAGGAKRLI